MEPLQRRARRAVEGRMAALEAVAHLIDRGVFFLMNLGLALAGLAAIVVIIGMVLGFRFW